MCAMEEMPLGVDDNVIEVASEVSITFDRIELRNTGLCKSVQFLHKTEMLPPLSRVIMKWQYNSGFFCFLGG